MIIRHPEKVNNPINPIKKKPSWIKTKILDTKSYFETKKIISKKKRFKFPFCQLLSILVLKTILFDSQYFHFQ